MCKRQPVAGPRRSLNLSQVCVFHLEENSRCTLCRAALDTSPVLCMCVCVRRHQTSPPQPAFMFQEKHKWWIKDSNCVAGSKNFFVSSFKEYKLRFCASGCKFLDFISRSFQLYPKMEKKKKTGAKAEPCWKYEFRTLWAIMGYKQNPLMTFRTSPLFLYNNSSVPNGIMPEKWQNDKRNLALSRCGWRVLLPQCRRKPSPSPSQRGETHKKNV